MKKIFVLFFLPLVAFTVVSDWKTVNIDSRVSIAFPNDPVVQDNGGNPTWQAIINDHTVCMAMIVDFEKFGLDSAGVATEMVKDEQFASFRDGMLGKMPGASVINEKKRIVSGRLTYDFIVDMGRDANSINKMYNRNIFVGSKLYSLSFLEKESQPEKNLRETFFASFKVN
jgi:hypothetical protein